MHFREADRTDTAKLAAVFFKSIRTGESPYTEAQRAAWLPAQPTVGAFADRIAGLYVVVAEEGRDTVGFMAMRPCDGYVDLAFIVPEARGKGAFRHMLEIIEQYALDIRLQRLWTHASLMAEPAFQAQGFSVIQHEMVDCADQKLPRAEMEKHLT